MWSLEYAQILLTFYNASFCFPLLKAYWCFVNQVLNRYSQHISPLFCVKLISCATSSLEPVYYISANNGAVKLDVMDVDMSLF